MRIVFKYKPPNKTLANLLAPDHKNLSPLSLEEAIKNYLTDIKDGPAWLLHKTKERRKDLFKVFSPQTDIFTITVRQFNSIKKSKFMRPQWRASHSESVLSSVIKNALHILDEPRPQIDRHQEIRSHHQGIKIKAAGLDVLRGEFPELIFGSGNGGRFAAFRTLIYDQVRSAKENEFRVIEPSREMLESKRERTAFMTSVVKFFKETNLPWVIRWAGGRQVFIIIRMADLEKAKKGGA